MKCAFLGTKIGGPFETAKRNLLKVVKGSEKVRFTSFQCPSTYLVGSHFHRLHPASGTEPSWFFDSIVSLGNLLKYYVEF
jgi:hypothetical protein